MVGSQYVVGVGAARCWVTPISCYQVDTDSALLSRIQHQENRGWSACTWCQAMSLLCTFHKARSVYLTQDAWSEEIMCHSSPTKIANQ